MSKQSTTKTLVNGEIADAEDVNQGLEDVGTIGGLIPYDETSKAKVADGSKDIGSVNNPWGDIYIEQNKNLNLVDTSTPEVVQQIPVADLLVPAGLGPLPWGASTPPSGWILSYGQSLAKNSYKQMYLNIKEILAEAAATGTFTATVATDRINITSHGLINGNIVTFTTSNTLPGGLSAGTVYYVINATTNDFQVSTTESGASVTITTTGTGTHYYHKNFVMPDLRGRTVVGKDNMGGSSANVITDLNADTLGGKFGAETTTLVADDIPALNLYVGSSSTGVWHNAMTATSDTMSYRQSLGIEVVNVETAETGHANVQPSIAMNMIFKT